MEKFEYLEKSMCHELEVTQNELKNGKSMTMQDLEKVDKLAHALKCLMAYEEKKEEMEYEMDGEGGMSGRRGRGANGRYVSRDGGNSYAEGYSRGYSEAMSQNQSGHYPDRGYYVGPGYPERHW